MLGSALYKTLLTDHQLQPPQPVAGECLSYFRYKAYIRAKIYGKQRNLAIRFYKQRYVERDVILLFNIINIVQRK